MLACLTLRLREIYYMWHSQVTIADVESDPRVFFFPVLFTQPLNVKLNSDEVSHSSLSLIIIMINVCVLKNTYTMIYNFITCLPDIWHITQIISHLWTNNLPMYCSHEKTWQTVIRKMINKSQIFLKLNSTNVMTIYLVQKCVY